MSKITVLWGWIIAFVTGILIVYGLDIPKRLFENKPLSMTENIIYGGFHRLAWAIAVGWVIFACSRGYGGNHFENVVGVKICTVQTTIPLCGYFERRCMS